MLTEEGKEAARDCLRRSGLVDSNDKLETLQTFSIKDQGNSLDSDSIIGSAHADAAKEVALPSSHLSSLKRKNDISPESLDRVCFSFFASLLHRYHFDSRLTVLNIHIHFYSMFHFLLSFLNCSSASQIKISNAR